MKNILILSLILLCFSIVAFSQNDSDQKLRLLEAREKERTRDERQKYYQTLTSEQRLQISDAEQYPTILMSYGKGFSEGFAKITQNGLAGFIDTTGKVVIKPAFAEAGYFSEGLAPVENTGGKWGFINQTGKTIINEQFDWAFSFKENRALVQINGKWGFIDKQGNLVIKALYDEASAFSEGVAHVEVKKLDNLPGYQEKRKIYKSGFIDQNGGWVIEPKWDGAEDFKNGLAEVCQNIGWNNGVVVDCFFIDRTGKKAFEFEMESDYPHFSENLVTVKDGSLYGAINTKGEMIIDAEFDELSPFSEGLAGFRDEKGLGGFIDRTGRILIKPKFKFVGRFSEGLAVASLPDDSSGRHLYGFINQKGKFIIKPQFESAWNFQDGRALIAEKYKTGYIDKTGQIIWKPTK